MTNQKTSNIIKVAAIFLLLCGASARPQAADGSDTGDLAIGFTFGTQVLSNMREACDTWLQSGGGASYTCERAVLVGSPYLRVGLAPRHSLMFAYSFSSEYEQTFTRFNGSSYTVTRSLQSGSIAYQHRLPLGETDTEGFLKIGYHFTEVKGDDSEDGKFSGDDDGVLLGAGIVYGDSFILGYEFLDYEEGDGIDINGHSFYIGAEFSL